MPRGEPTFREQVEQRLEAEQTLKDLTVETRARLQEFFWTHVNALEAAKKQVHVDKAGRALKSDFFRSEAYHRPDAEKLEAAWSVALGLKYEIDPPNA